jgi:acyl-CoA synthetase (AMP-forming)/AMP-acid ligase II
MDMNNCNFAGLLAQRVGPASDLIDAATGETVPGVKIPCRLAEFAGGFFSAGLQPGDRILLGCGLNPISALAYLGAMYAGLVPVPLEERALAVSGEPIYAKTSAKAIWTFRAIQCDWIRERRCLHLTGKLAASKSEHLPPTPRTQDDLAALMATSGSTGAPRLVMVSHGNLIANTEAIVRSQRLGANERAMLILPISYCFGASVLHTHLYMGGGVVLDSRFTFPNTVLEAMSTYGCTTFAGVPTAYNILLHRSNLRSISLTRLRRFLQAGGALAPEAAIKIQDMVPTAKFFVMYGQTEATSRISCLPPEYLNEKLGSAGRPLDNLEVRIVDEEGRELPSGQTGEIWVRGPSVCCGYLDSPEESARKFHDGWLKTGDLGELDQDGFIRIRGRKSDFIKIRGIRVSLAEVEAKVDSVPGVYECAAVVTPHPEAGEALSLFVVPQPEAGDLPLKIRRALPTHWTCQSVDLMTTLPKTLNGKLVRSELI